MIFDLRGGVGVLEYLYNNLMKIWMTSTLLASKHFFLVIDSFIIHLTNYTLFLLLTTIFNSEWQFYSLNCNSEPWTPKKTSDVYTTSVTNTREEECSRFSQLQNRAISRKRVLWTHRIQGWVYRPPRRF